MNLLNNMKVRTRIGLLAALLLFLLVISVFYGLKLAADADKGLQTVYSDRVIPLKQLKIISDEYAVNIVDTSHLVRSGKISWSKGLDNIQRAKKNIHEEMNAYLATELVAKEKELVRTLKAQLETADKSTDKLQKIISQNDKQQLIEFVENELYPSIDPVTEIIARLIDVQLEVAQQVYITAEKDYHNGRQIMFSFIGASALLAILVTFLIGKSITSQLGDEPQNIQHIANRIALGDLDAASRIDRIKSRGVSKALLEINDSLSSISNELKSATNRINLGDLRFRGETKNLSGFFAELMNSSNNLAESLVDYLDDIANPISCIDSNQQTLFLNKNAKSNPHLLPTQHSRKKCLEFLEKASPNTDYKAILNEQDLEIINMKKENDDITATYTGISILDDNNKVIGVFEILVDQTKVIGMQRKISALAEKASEISERLANSTVDLNYQVDEASNGAAVQSDRTAETATAMEEMNATVLEVAKNAGRAAKNTSMTKDKAQMGAEVVGHVVQVIGEVQQQADSLKVDTEEMGRQAEGIGHIIEVISDIADQTNLLALNAAIEAARAGEAGRGFAVVADEVRKLAEKTMTATTEVNNAVNAIQQSSHKNIASTESAVTTIAESTRLADQAGEVLNEIVAFSDDSSEQVQSIATASEQQSATADEITRSTEEVDRISQETSSSMNNAARSVEEITTMIRELDKLIQAMAS